MTAFAASQIPNHLIHEKSPYLLQHAYNPVDWYPWGDEAFEKAKKENKPILVSIGYSTCHWCHVMEHESYEDPAVAALMNKYLINIKVDREERPDVDKIYMTAVSAMTGSGGWPLNVFLTPDLKPFFGGTYFPPQSKWGQPAWTDVVTQIGKTWQNPEERKKMLAAGEHIAESLRKFAASAAAPVEGDATWLDAGFKEFEGVYDASRGGFGGAPKFPMPVYHNFLLRYYARNRPSPALRAPSPRMGEGQASPAFSLEGEGGRRPDEGKHALKMSVHTLQEMAKGGIYDQIGGGFARYSTDADWRVPHFEKMLYDNAQLAVNYIEAYQITQDPELARVARETLDYVRRDMTNPEGGFYSAEDADSLPSADATEKKEGAFYVWEKVEIMGILGDRSGEVVSFRYGVRDQGNAASDPHGEFTNKNILYIAHSIPETARQFNMTEAEVLDILADAKKRLFDARTRLPRPQTDDKIISGWNGLMISAFAKGYQVLGDSEDLGAAQKAARFLKANLYDTTSRQLYRRWRDPKSSSPAASGRGSMDSPPTTAGNDDVLGIADDYAFLAQGLIDLYEADFDPAWLDWSAELTEEQIKRFYDKENGGFFMTAPDQDPHLLVRVKEDQDNVEPSASSVAALNLLRLSQYFDRQDFQKEAEKTLKAFGTQMKESPRAMPQMLVALDFALTEPRQIVIAGTASAPDTQAMLKTLHAHFIPVKTVMLADGGPIQKHLAQKLDFLAGMRPIDGKATAYVCEHHVCKQPTADLKTFEKLLSVL